MNRCANTAFVLVLSALMLLSTACTEGGLELATNHDTPTYTLDEYLAALQVVTVDDQDIYVYQDMQFSSIEDAEDFYWHTWSADGALILNGGGALDTRRVESDIRFCVSNAFGSDKAAIVEATIAGANDWASAANLNFTYDASRDGNCTSAGSIDIAVRPTEADFIASAFFPRRGNAEGNLLVVVDAFFQDGLSTAGVMRHELGHILGFRHEHTRFQNNPCYENSNWTPITEYDSSSTMHYPQCNGTGSFSSLALTDLDREGASIVYGAP